MLSLTHEASAYATVSKKNCLLFLKSLQIYRGAVTQALEILCGTVGEDLHGLFVVARSVESDMATAHGNRRVA